VIDPHTNPAISPRQIIDPLGDPHAQLLVAEVVSPNPLGRALGPPRAAGVAEIPDQFPLLGVDGDHGLVTLLEPPDTSVDVLELRVAIGVVVPLLGLAIGWEAIADVLEGAADRIMTDLVAEGDEGLGPVTGALGGPEPWGLGISEGGGLEELGEVVQESRVALGEARASGPRPADPAGRRLGPGIVELSDSGSDGGARESGGLGDGRSAAPSESLRLGGGPAAEDTLVDKWGEGLRLRWPHRYSFLGVHVRNLRAIAMPN
jgi:hypothetical protein